METLPAVLQGFMGKGNISGPAIWNVGNSWRHFVFQVDVGEYRHQDGLLCQEGRSFCSTGFARCSLQGGIPSRLMIVSVISFRFKTTGAFSTAFWLISVCFGKTETGMGDRIQSENDVNRVPVIGGHLVSR